MAAAYGNAGSNGCTRRRNHGGERESMRVDIPLVIRMTDVCRNRQEWYPLQSSSEQYTISDGAVQPMASISAKTRTSQSTAATTSSEARDAVRLKCQTKGRVFGMTKQSRADRGWRKQARDGPVCDAVAEVAQEGSRTDARAYVHICVLV